jgi:hypothetical protein
MDDVDVDGNDGHDDIWWWNWNARFDPGDRRNIKMVMFL